MRKPNDPITSHTDWDYDLIEHVARALEHSSLHVAASLNYVDVPEELGGDGDEDASLSLNIVYVSDGERGWLALTQASDEVDWTHAANDLLEEAVGDDESAPWFARTAQSWEEQVPLGALDLRSDRRARIEAEFERCFAGAPSHAPEAFDVIRLGLSEFGYPWESEGDIRVRMNEDGAEGFAKRA